MALPRAFQGDKVVPGPRMLARWRAGVAIGLAGALVVGPVAIEPGLGKGRARHGQRQEGCGPDQRGARRRAQLGRAQWILVILRATRAQAAERLREAALAAVIAAIW